MSTGSSTAKGRDGGRPRVTIIAERVVRRPDCEQSGWARALVRGLSAAGIATALVCDGCDDPAGVAPAELIDRRLIRLCGSRKPDAFRAWAPGRVNALGAPAVSLTPLLGPGEVEVPAAWLPTGATAADEIERTLRRGGPASITLEALHRLWVPRLWRAEKRAAASWAPAGSGAQPPPEAPGGGLLCPGDWAPPWGWGGGRRVEVREPLGIAAGARVIAVPVSHAQTDAGLARVFEAVGAVKQERGAGPLVVLTLGFPLRRVARLAAGHCPEARLVQAGQTFAATAVLRESDVGVLWRRRRATPGAGRFAAACASVGLPVVRVGRAAEGARAGASGLAADAAAIDRALDRAGDPAEADAAAGERGGRPAGGDPSLAWLLGPLGLADAGASAAVRGV